MIVETFDEGDFKTQIEILPKVSEVTFIDGPMHPVETIATVTRGYTGIYEASPPDPEEIDGYLKDLNNTKLKTPLEFGTVVFLVKGVPRSWTHQAVRTRIGASFVQESMRFLGHQKIYRIMVSKNILRIPHREFYLETLHQCIIAYEFALKDGASSEDARSCLPTDILTNIFIGYQISTFAKVYEQRMCCQAQPGVWQDFARKARELLIHVYGGKMGELISAPYERGEPCGYRASFDRPCIWQQKDHQS